MKQINTIKLTLLSTLVLAGCSNSALISPSQNSALNAITPHGKEKDGVMQKSLDSWLKEDWTPTVEKDEKIRDKYMEKIEEKPSQIKSSSDKEITYIEKEDKPFTLQEFTDKATVYLKAQEDNSTTSHVKKLESMPVIGTQK
jgi:hypothetical protein